MHSSNGNEAEFDNVSENFVEDELIDNLYVLKSSLVHNKKLTKDSHSHISQIVAILEDHPELCQALYKWGFLLNEGLYCLRSEFLFLKALKIITMAVSSCKKVPDFYFSKKFLFFISEKLYFSLGGARHHSPQNKIDVSNYDEYFKTDEDVNETDENIMAKEPVLGYLRNKPHVISTETREIIDFCRVLIEVDSSSIIVLHELRFFDICNTVIIIESAKLFNSVFRDLYHKAEITQEAPERPWEQDGLYEIHRKLFDPEIIFRTKNILYPKKPLYKYKNGVYNNIYKECTNWRVFAELSVKEFLDFLLFKRVIFMNDDIDTALREEINIKILRFYRRSLEEGESSDSRYLPFLIKNIEEKEASREICVILYYFTDFITDFRKFTELRIRAIFENLEYLCEIECKKQDNTQTDRHQSQGLAGLADFDTRSEVPVTEVNSVKSSNTNSGDASFSSSLCSNDIFGDGPVKTQFQAPCDVKQPSKAVALKTETSSICSFADIREADVGAQSIGNFSENFCERLRILRLIKFLYNSMNKELFYKPSYVILLRSIYSHCSSEKDFIDVYFSDFLLYLNSDDLKIAECLFLTKFSTKQPKMVEFHLSDDLMNIENSGDKENFENILMPQNSSGESELNLTRRGSKKVKESDELSDVDENILHQSPANTTFDCKAVEEDYD